MKLPLPFGRSPLGARRFRALGQGATSRFSLGEGRSSCSWPSRPSKPALAHLGFLSLPSPALILLTRVEEGRRVHLRVTMSVLACLSDNLVPGAS